jgi:hypothetical protein
MGYMYSISYPLDMFLIIAEFIKIEWRNIIPFLGLERINIISGCFLLQQERMLMEQVA